MKRFSLSGILGIVTGIGMVLTAASLDGDPLTSLLQLTAAMIVFGGTIGSLMIHFGFPDLTLSFKRLMWLISPPEADIPGFVEKLVEWAKIVRKDSMLALDSELQTIKNPFLHRGLQMIIDARSSPEEIRETLELMDFMGNHRDSPPAELWEAAGGYAPTIGVLGAVLGLIHVMLELNHPSQLGGGIATAFVATVYGVGSANLLFIPIGSRLKRISQNQALYRMVVIEGLMMLGQKSPAVSPMALAEKMSCFVHESPKKKKKDDKEAQT